MSTTKAISNYNLVSINRFLACHVLEILQIQQLIASEEQNVRRIGFVLKYTVCSFTLCCIQCLIINLAVPINVIKDWLAKVRFAIKRKY